MTGHVRRLVASPRVRLIVVLLLVLVALALTWHLVGMAAHSPGMLGGACLALTAIGLVVVLFGPIGWVPAPLFVEAAAVSPASTLHLPRLGRAPPGRGIVLLM